MLASRIGTGHLSSGAMRWGRGAMEVLVVSSL